MAVAEAAVEAGCSPLGASSGECDTISSSTKRRKDAGLRKHFALIAWTWVAAWAFASFWIGWTALVPAFAGVIVVYFHAWREAHKPPYPPTNPAPLLGVLYPDDETKTGGK